MYSFTGAQLIEIVKVLEEIPAKHSYDVLKMIHETIEQQNNDRQQAALLDQPEPKE